MELLSCTSCNAISSSKHVIQTRSGRNGLHSHSQIVMVFLSLFTAQFLIKMLIFQGFGINIIFLLTLPGCNFDQFPT